MYPYARTIYSQHLTGRTKVLYERGAEVSVSGYSLASESTRLRARQNVLYELGHFAGKYWYSRRASTKDVQILLSYCIPSLMNMAAGNANC